MKHPVRTQFLRRAREEDQNSSPQDIFIDEHNKKPNPSLFLGGEIIVLPLPYLIGFAGIEHTDSDPPCAQSSYTSIHAVTRLLKKHHAQHRVEGLVESTIPNE